MMADPRQILEAKKAAILAAADKQVSEIDADIQALERLADKYGLDVVARTGDTLVMLEAKDASAATSIPISGSLYTRAKQGGELIIRAAGKPVPLADIHEELVKRGVIIGGKTPKNTLSAYLGQNPNLISTSRGWWLKDVPLPGTVIKWGELAESHDVGAFAGGGIRRR
jgi:hypothetical protein